MSSFLSFSTVRKFAVAALAVGALSAGASLMSTSEAEARGHGGGVRMGGHGMRMGHVGGIRHMGGVRHIGHRHFVGRHHILPHRPWPRPHRPHWGVIGAGVVVGGALAATAYAGDCAVVRRWVELPDGTMVQRRRVVCD